MAGDLIETARPAICSASRRLLVRAGHLAPAPVAGAGDAPLIRKPTPSRLVVGASRSLARLSVTQLEPAARLNMRAHTPRPRLVSDRPRLAQPDDEW